MGKGSYLGLSSKKKVTHIELYFSFFIFLHLPFVPYSFFLGLVCYLSYAISFCLFYDICE